MSRRRCLRSLPTCMLSPCLFLLLSASAVHVQAQPAEDLRVFTAPVDGVEPRDMLQQHLRAHVRHAAQRWRDQYEQRKSPEAIADYQKRIRERFLEALGPFPERTPLNAKVTGKVQRDGYTVEKVLFESRPNHYVTAAFYLPDPDKYPRPVPGVLVPCGHSRNGKAAGAYQQAPALLALNGVAAMCFDPIGQGERMQLLDDAGKPRLHGTGEHTMIGISAILLGRNTASFEVWDGMRAIDYLASRPEVDGERIGCMGVSGGGTQTSYFMSLDDRIQAAAPACYITSFERLVHTIGPQDAEQNIHGQLAFGMDHADYLMVRAPMPTLVCAATRDFFDIEGTWTSYRYAKRLYTRMGHGERLSIVENDAGHNYNSDLRAASVHWMVRWLAGRDVHVTEPDIAVLPDEQIWASPKGQVMLIEGAVSAYDLNIGYEKELAAKRELLWASREQGELLKRVREIAGVAAMDDLPAAKVEEAGTVTREGLRISKLALTLEGLSPRITLPALMFEPTRPGVKEPAVLYLHGAGKHADAGPDGPIARLALDGHNVLAVDLRGMGETNARSGFKDTFTAYLLGKSLVGMRAEDALVSAKWLASRSGQRKPVRLIAVGDAAVPALHAAALEPAMFESVELRDGLDAWASLVRAKTSEGSLIHVVHGALTTYDLPDLRRVLGGKLK